MHVLNTKILTIGTPDTGEPKKTESGLLVVNTARSYETVTETIVEDVGDEVSIIKKGDTIIYSSGAGVSFKRGDTTYRVLDVKEVLAIV